jgi:hypothetical protein
MKTNNLALLVASASCVGLTAFAADPATTSMVWDFSTPDNPSVQQPTGDTNPFDAVGTVTIETGLGGGGYFGGVAYPEFPGDFGTATGVWDTLNGSVTVGLDQLAGTAGGLLDYTLVLRQYVNNPPGFPYSPALQFSVPGVELVSQVPVETIQSAGASWVVSTYRWQQVAVDGFISLTLSTDPNRNMLLDSLSFSVTGDLVPIPEPNVAQLGALAALMLGVGSFRRSKRQA